MVTLALCHDVRLTAQDYQVVTDNLGLIISRTLLTFQYLLSMIHKIG